MRKTTFVGLTALGPEDSIFADGAAFTTRDRDEIDRGIKLGAKIHRHTGLPGLSDPSLAPSASIIASGGAIDAGVSISVGYTLEDSAGGETLISPLSIASTPTPLDVPVNAPEVEADYTAGTLMANTYAYAVTYLDGEGGETPLGPSTLVVREPGSATARMKVSGLTTGMEEAGAVGYRLYRALGGGDFAFLTEGEAGEDTFTDDGSVSPVCDDNPPTDSINTTNKISTLQVHIPAGLDTNAAFINLYATTTGSFDESSLLAQYPMASAGASPTFTELEFLDSQPPDVNRSYGGADQIDPDTELLDWHWKRPVAASGLLGSGSLGDVKLVENSGELYAVLMPLASAGGPQQWTKLASAAAASAAPGSKLAASAETGGRLTDLEELIFLGSGGIKVAVGPEGTGKAKVTITGPTLPTVPPQLIASAASGNPGSVNPAEKLTLAAGSNVFVGLSNPKAGEAQYTISASGTRLSASAETGGKLSNLDGLTFVGSAGIKTSVNSLGGSEAKITITGPDIPQLTASATPGQLKPTEKLTLVGSGGTQVSMATPGGGEARVTITSPQVTQLTASAGSAKPGSVSSVQKLTLAVDRTHSIALSNPTAGEALITISGPPGKDWGLVSKLPEGAVRGDRCMYQAAGAMIEQGVIWELVHNGTNWSKTGGAPLFARSDKPPVLNNKTTFTSLSEEPLSLTVPLAGTYDIRIEGTINNFTGGRAGELSYSVGGTAASTAWAIRNTSGAQVLVNGSLMTRHTGVAEGDTIEEKGVTGGAYEIQFARRRLWIDPVTVG